MNEEQLYKRAFGEMQTLLNRAETDVALVKAQAEFYLEAYNNLQEEHNKLIEEKEELRKEYNSLLDENNQLKEDLRKLEGEPDLHKTEENK
nr:MAG TPA: Polyubiquitin-C, TNFAIP3-interacting protein 1-binding domain, A20-binding protein, SIGNALING.01A [Caudoviricetes sp.]